MAFTDSAAETQDAGPPQPGGSPMTPPQGGGALAALTRQRQGPQASAPGQGDEASALVALKNAVEMIQNALHGLPAGSKGHTQAINALRQLSRVLPQGAPTAGVQQTQLLDLLRGVMRNALMQKIMANRGGAQGAPGEEGAPAGPMDAQAPMPSTPLPGA